MKATFAVILLVCTTTAQAADVRLKNGIIVLDRSVGAHQTLPEFTRHMSDEEYFFWATEQNRQTLAAVKPQEDHIRYVNVMENSGSNKTRFGGGVGYGGYGGSGGYAGYLGASDLFNGGGGGYGGGGGSYMNQAPGNAVGTSYNNSRKMYQLEIHDWPIGQPVTLLNPFCRPHS
ncbi:MAG TPA: hypothetical protein VHC22_04745 [Pirellulales bacterium]|nr:hypothetical protein [Pirellulales bacterium]